MSPPKSKVWGYFIKIDGNLCECKTCGKKVKFSGNTSNLFKHLKVKHSHIRMEDGVNKNKPEPTLRKTLLTLDPTHTEPTPSTSKSAESLDDHKEFRPILPIVEAFKNVSSFQDGGAKHHAITQAILYFICRDMRPFAVVDGCGFKKLMKTISPMYVVPSGTTLKRKMNEKYEMCALRVKADLAQVKSFCLTTDIWTDTLNERSYLGVTIHYLVDGDVCLKLTNLGVVLLQTTHTGENISAALMKLTSEWGIPKEKIAIVVTDNGANVVSTINMFVGKNKHVPCFAHTINLVVESFLKNINALQAIEKVRAIVKWVKNSVKASDKFRHLQSTSGIPEGEHKKLILDISTRWNSTFYMLQRFLEMVNIISQLVVEDLSTPEMPTNRELSDLKNILRLLQPFEHVTREASGEKYTTLSTVIPMVNILIKQLENITISESDSASPIEEAKIAVIREVKRRFSNIEHNLNMAVATILDPRFKNLHFNDAQACAKVIAYLRKQVRLANMDTAQSASSSDEEKGKSSDFDFWAIHKELVHGKRSQRKDQIDDQLSLYLNNPTSPLKTDPLKEWDDMKNVFPVLYKHARIALMFVATSVPCERLFSKTGFILNQTRNRLSPKNLGRLLFLSGLREEEWGI